MVVIGGVLGGHHVALATASSGVVVPAGVPRTVSVHYGGHFCLFEIFTCITQIPHTDLH